MRCHIASGGEGGVVPPPAPPRDTPARVNLAFLTDRAHPDGTPDDRLLLPGLHRAGVTTRFVVWDDPLVDLSDIDRVVVRSTWDYYLRLDAFEAFLGGVPCPMHNPLPALRWNARKSYLTTLGECGIPTRLHTGGISPLPWTDAWTDAWPELVVKPEVSAGGHETFRVRRGEFPTLAPGVRYLVQPFLPEVLTAGEISYIFLGGKPSHAVQKRPRSGNFLVQEEHGGSTVRVEPTADEWAFAAARLADIPVEVRGSEPLLYARVDCIAGYVVELELIEPALYLRFDERSPARFVRGLLALS